MFSWIEKVIPQPPETPKKSAPDAQSGGEAQPLAAQPTLEKCDEKAACVVKEPSNTEVGLKAQERVEESEKGAAGVLSWLAQGLGKVVPQPVESPSLARANNESTELVTEQALAPEKQKPVSDTEKTTDNGPTDQTDSAPLGVFSWFSQGLEKVVPQPTRSQRMGTSGGSEAPSVSVEQKPQIEEKCTKIEETKVPPPVSPVHTSPPAPVAVSPPALIEVQPAPSTEQEVAATEKGSGAGVLNWLMQGLGKVVPQPETPIAPIKKEEEEKPKIEEQPTPVTRKDSKGR
ncbi:cyclic nucleotide-gated channel beta-1-like [Rhinophrynus dorsalis]